MSKNPLTMIMETNKFNCTNCNDWRQNLRIVLDFENHGCVFDKPLPRYCRKAPCSKNVLHSRSGLRTTARHIRYAAAKAFFRTKIAKGLSVQSHKVKTLSLVEKLEDLNVGLDNDTYIDVIV
ncbi:UNVERIFIED_CONTAM: hypothetical protein Sindi_2678600 [Sesamum indicum]